MAVFVKTNKRVTLDLTVTRSLVPTLPGAAYTDADLFTREQERIFERMWFCAGGGRGRDRVHCGQFEHGARRELAAKSTLRMKCTRQGCQDAPV